MSIYETLSKIDVSEFTEKKGKFTYLSWANAVDILLKHYPEATWDVVRDDNHIPYVCTPNGAFVTVWVEIQGIRRTISHPVLDFRNSSVVDPDAFVVNTSIQRALAKCISLHGLGLYIYRGEDLPEAPKGQTNPNKPLRQNFIDRAVEVYRECIDADVDEIDYRKMQYVESNLTSDEKMAALDAFGNEKPEGSKRMYKNIINDCLKKHPADEVAA